MTKNLPDVPADVPPDLFALDRCRVSSQYKAAFMDMIHRGASPQSAAEAHGIRLTNLRRALARPHVRAAYNQTLKAVRDGAAQQAYLRINGMAQEAQSDRLKFDANRWIAGVDGISPVQKVEGRVSHNVQFTGFDYPDLGAKDITPKDSQSHDDD